jgi:hypothetical protein
MPIAINPVEQVMLSFFTVVSTILARLGVISADPSY